MENKLYAIDHKMQVNLKDTEMWEKTCVRNNDTCMSNIDLGIYNYL